MKLELRKFYRSRDGRTWETLKTIPMGYERENSLSDGNRIYSILTVCHSTRTYNFVSENGISRPFNTESHEDIIEEILNEPQEQNDKRFVRSAGKLYCVNSKDEVCTYLYEELPPELKGVWRVQSTTIKNFTYEDYCKFYEIEPIYTKKLTPEEEFDNFVKSCNDGEWSKSLGCQKEAAVEFLIAYKNLMKAMGKFSDDVKSYPKCLIREVFKDYPEYAKFEIPTMFKNQDGKDFKNFAAPLVEKMKKILN